MDTEAREEADARRGDSLIDRLFESKVLWVLLFISFLWTLAIFIVPFTIAPGTVTDLEGNANRIDFSDLWNSMPPHASIVYYLGDAECHQISSRTIYLNENQMPVCARDTSIFLFITIGLFAGMLTKRNYYVTEGLLSVFPRRVQDAVKRTIGAMWFAVVFVVLCLIPVGLDGGIQLITDYESGNLSRFLTGIPAGFIAGLLIAILVKSVKATKEFRDDYFQSKKAQSG
ncbi:MAG: DUF2085 domain-containing protein [Thermoplasmata archaeon]|nr:DUF2085 domain-containing protein [Thermoplasmata archaeon]